MLTSFVLGQPPFIQATNLLGRFMPYGKMYTKDWDTREDKATYEDPDGIVELDNPVIADDIGRFPMIWFATDVPYYLEFRDQNDNLIFQTPQPYIPGIGSGSILDEALDSPNLFINGQFNNYTIQSYSPVPHEINDLAPVGWRWFQDGTNTSDTLQFVPFSIDNNAISPPAINYLNYTSTLAGTGESYKNLAYRFSSVRTLCGEQVTLQFEGLSQVAGTFQLTAMAVQDFGTGGSPSPAVTTILGAVTLTNAYDQYAITGTIPNLTGKTLGSNGDSFLYIMLGFPLNTAQNIHVTNLYFKRGIAVTGFPYISPLQTLAQIYGYNSHVSTGDIKPTFKTNADQGWVFMNDGSIGSPTSGATTRANVDTYALYKLLWNGVSSPTENGYCAVNGGLGANADADFLANKRMNLPAALGRALVATGGSLGLALGANTGVTGHALTAANFPTGLTFNSVVSPNPHSHTVNAYAVTGSTTLNSAGTEPTGDSSTTDGVSLTVTTTGPVGAADTPFSVVQPVLAVNYMIKL